MSSAVIHIVGILVVLMGLLMTVPGMYGVYLGERDASSLFVASAITLSAGILLRLLSKPGRLSNKGGLITVVLGWFLAIAFGSLPYILSGEFGGICNSIFEVTSGFTTTGASILTDIERIPQCLLLWRAMTHWIGGLGIIMMVTIVFPFMEGPGFHLVKSEAGLLSQRFKPKLRDTGLILCEIYILLTALEIFFLMLGGMDAFDALCHSFATVATGGFSTRNESVAYYHSQYIEAVIILFMFLSAVNYFVYFAAFRGNLRKAFSNTELKSFIGIIAVLTLVSFCGLLLYGKDREEQMMRDSLFQVVSVISTTGFGTVNIDTWPDLCKFVMILCMFIGGCVGSTSGALKVRRIVVIGKVIVRELKLIVNPQRVIKIKIDGEPVDERTIAGVLNYFAIWILLFLLVAASLLALGESSATSVSATASAMGGVGPGFDKIASNWDGLPAAGKWLLCFAMLAGRLEIFALLMILSPSLWRRDRRGNDPPGYDRG